MHCLISFMTRIKSFLYCIILKILHPHNFEFSGSPIVGKDSRFICNNGKIIINNIGVRRYCEISASENSVIRLDKKVFLNNGCMIISHKSITIGENTRLGPNVLIYDHDYDYKNHHNFEKGIHNSKEITIGNGCWIGAGTIILKGTVLGDNCVVAAGSIIKGEYQAGTLIVQKRIENIKKNH